MAKKQAKSEDKQYIELVNWKKAQPRMKGKNNEWIKFYTSLLEHEGYAGLDDAARVLISALWLYAARSGKHVLPADPAWIWRKIPMLNQEPDLEPLLECVDEYGNATPFIKYCKPPKKRAAAATKKPAKKASQKRAEESREEKREESREETIPDGIEKKREREEKDGLSPESKQQSSQQQQTEPAADKSDNPIESEVEPAKVAFIPSRPARSATGAPERLGSVVNAWLPGHWQDPDAEAFGWEIIKALGMPADPDDKRIRAEWGAFASFWHGIKQIGLDDMTRSEIRDKAIVKADYLRRKGRSAKNKSAVWFHVMSGELQKRGIKSLKARASP